MSRRQGARSVSSTARGAEPEVVVQAAHLFGNFAFPQLANHPLDVVAVEVTVSCTVQYSNSLYSTLHRDEVSPLTGQCARVGTVVCDETAIVRTTVIARHKNYEVRSFSVAMLAGTGFLLHMTVGLFEASLPQFVLTV